MALIFVRVCGPEIIDVFCLCESSGWKGCLNFSWIYKNQNNLFYLKESNSQSESNFNIFRQSGVAASSAGRSTASKGRFNLLQFYNLSSPVHVLFGARTLIQFLQFVIVALQLQNFICCNFTKSSSALVRSMMTCKNSWVGGGMNATNLRNLTLSQQRIQWRQQSQL